MSPRSGVRRSIIAALAVAAALVTAQPAAARDATVTSFDGTPIATHFFPAAGLEAGEKAATVLIGPGWSVPGETNPSSAGNPVLENFGVTPIGDFVRHGYNVLTWDPRGFGRSGGTVMVDDYRYEGRDMQALLDFAAQQPEALLDAPGDPHAGMAGASYGGIIQLVTAAIDRRLEAIVPNITPHNLTSSLFKERAVKAGWGAFLVGAGAVGSTVPGLFASPPQTGHMDPHIYDSVAGGALNTVSDENYSWYAERGPGFLVRNIRIPTLLTQGIQDTLFTPQEAIDNFNVLAANSGAPLKMLWFCGGHGACLTDPGPAGYLRARTLAWLDRYLKGDTSVDTGPRFEWLAEDGVWRSAANYPLKSAGALTGAGSGVLPISPVQTSGVLILATPPAAPGTAAEVEIPGPDGEANVLGAPRLRLTYSGTGAPAKTFLYAQVLDTSRNIVVGNQATPIPVLLDGRQHTVERPLEPIASRAAPGQDYKLQLIPSTSLYSTQSTLGLASLPRIEVELPLVDAAGTPPPGASTPLGATARKRAKKRRCRKRRATAKQKRRCAKRAKRKGKHRRR